MHVAGQLLAIYTAVSLSFDLFPHMLIVVVSGTGWEQDGCIVCAIWATVGRERRRNKEATHHSGTPRKRKGRVGYTAGRWKEVTCPDLKMTVCILTGILLNTLSTELLWINLILLFVSIDFWDCLYLILSFCAASSGFRLWLDNVAVRLS